eukprot:5531166-Pleurochrysis_carterae.AAC.1
MSSIDVAVAAAAAQRSSCSTRTALFYSVPKQRAYAGLLILCCYHTCQFCKSRIFSPQNLAAGIDLLISKYL